MNVENTEFKFVQPGIDGVPYPSRRMADAARQRKSALPIDGGYAGVDYISTRADGGIVLEYSNIYAGELPQIVRAAIPDNSFNHLPA